MNEGSNKETQPSGYIILLFYTYAFFKEPGGTAIEIIPTSIMRV